MILTLIIETVLLIALLITLICLRKNTKQIIAKLQKERDDAYKSNEFHIKELQKRAGVENVDLH